MIKKHHTIDQFVDIIKHVVDEAVAEKSPVRQRTGDEASENVIVENASVSD